MRVKKTTVTTYRCPKCECMLDFGEDMSSANIQPTILPQMS